MQTTKTLFPLYEKNGNHKSFLIDLQPIRTRLANVTSVRDLQRINPTHVLAPLIYRLKIKSYIPPGGN